MSFAFLLPNELDAPTGGYAYARRCIAAWRERAVEHQVLTLDGAFPQPDAQARLQVAQRLAELADGQTTLIDGLALGTLPHELAPHAQRLDLVALVHHPLYRESGLDHNARQQLFASERTALGHCNRVITTSAATAAGLQREFGVPADRIHVAEPGTDRPSLANRASTSAAVLSSARTDPPLQLLCVASVVPRKGHLVLLEALTSLRSFDWQLSCVGALDRDVQYVNQVAAQIDALGLAQRVRLCGALAHDDIQQAWLDADVFVLASQHEGYGMAFAEAMSYGLPIVGTVAAAVPQLQSGAALLVPADAPAALSQALFEVMQNASLRTRLANAALTAARTLPTWADTAQSVHRVLLAAHPGGVIGRHAQL